MPTTDVARDGRFRNSVLPKPSPFAREEISDTDEGQPMTILGLFKSGVFRGPRCTAGCNGWENGLAYRASCGSPSEYREDCLCKP